MIKSEPREHLKEFNYEEEQMGLFVNEYKKSLLEQFLVDHRFQPKSCELVNGTLKMSKSCTIKIQL